MVKSVKLARDAGSLKGLKLKNILSTFGTVQLINGSSVKPYVIESKLPWHVIGTVALIDRDSLKNRLDICIDAWRWGEYKTQTSSTANISNKARYSVCDRLGKHQMTKSYHKCTENHDFKRQILLIYPGGI